MNLLVLNAKQNSKAIKILVFGFIFNFLLTFYRGPFIMLKAVILQQIHSPHKMFNVAWCRFINMYKNPLYL